jgi:hypothetical protein
LGSKTPPRTPNFSIVSVGCNDTNKLNDLSAIREGAWRPSPLHG